jgi:PncC family amidohydrolase
MIDDLLPLAAKAGALLKQRGLTIAVAESSSGGLISAALLSVPGASAYFVGGAVTYTRKAREAMLGIPDSALAGTRPVTEPHERIVARLARERFGASLCLVEHGAAGPTGNRYGDPPGRSCIVILGETERATMIETGRPDRAENMQAFAAGALKFLVEYLEA